MSRKKKQSGLARAAKGPMPAAPPKAGYQPNAKPVGYVNLQGNQNHSVKRGGLISNLKATGAVYNPATGKTLLTYGKQPKAKGAVYMPHTGQTLLTY